MSNHQPVWSRRELLGAAALLAMVVGTPAAIAYAEAQRSTGASKRQAALLTDVAQIVIPRTATAGAGEAGVAAFVALALDHGMGGADMRFAGDQLLPELKAHVRTNGRLDYLGWLENQLDRATGGDFMSATAAAQLAALETLDKAAFANTPSAAPWRTIKGLILTGYYTSEIGGSQELQYELVPGRWDNDLPYPTGQAAWSSDWTAVEFS